MLLEHCNRLFALLTLLLCSVTVYALPAFPASSESQSPLTLLNDEGNRNVSLELFAELEELARIVDISYCVGTTGIQKPFSCVSRCSEFDGFELITTWNTGPLLSDSCGYIVLSHAPLQPRIIVAFRGTYSLANTIVDLSTVPQEYIPYPGGNASATASSSVISNTSDDTPCYNCTVHSGFYTSWQHTRPHVVPHLESLIAKHPTYRLTLVGHSLGGAVAAIGALEMQSRGWKPQVTTFGEPRIGNKALMKYIDLRFDLGGLEEGITKQTVEKRRRSSYRRVTHVDDPVPLLPLREWGYRMHAGEVYISKKDLSPAPNDLEHCFGDEDLACIAGTDSGPPDDDADLGAAVWRALMLGGLGDADADERPDVNLDADVDVHVPIQEHPDGPNNLNGNAELKARGLVPSRFKLWELFFAHRDYFWRLGLCVPGGDPHDWYRKYPHLEE